jgi:uncharacterized membrane protein
VPPSPQGPPLPPPPAAGAPDLPDNLATALCYFFWALSGVVFLVLEPYNRSKLIRFHAWQSILISAAVFAGWFVVLIAATMLRILPYIGYVIASALVSLYGLAVLAVWLLSMFKAYQGSSLELPFISDFARKQA